MKQFIKLGILVFLGFIAFSTSCKKDIFTEEDAFSSQEDLELLKDSLATSQALLLDSLQKAGGIINYSVGVVLASDATWITSGGFSKGTDDVKGLDAVTVTIAQYGKVVTATTDVSGIASFKDLRIGTVNVNVKKTGYTEVDFIATLPALLDSVYTDAYNLVRHVGTMVPVFSLTTNLSTISGLATVETDLTNNTRELAANVKIMGTIDGNSSSFTSRYLYNPAPDAAAECDCEWWWFDYYGVIKQIAFHSAISTATTAADGSFTMQVPSTPDGLPILLIADEFAANQSLLQATVNNIPVWGVQSIRTLYGNTSLYFTYSDIPSIGTGSGQVQSAYVTFSAPTGTPSPQPTTDAEATAVLASSGIVSIHMIDQGEGYTQAPGVKIELGSAYNSVQAEGTAVVSGGKVTSVTITSAGSGYKPDDEPALTFEESVDREATASAEFSFSVVDVEMDGYGSGYTQTPPNVTIVGSGTGATAHAVMSATIDSINVTATGSGYTDEPLVTISDNFGASADAEAVMTEYNPLHSITYNVTNTQLWPASPVPTVYIFGVSDVGAGATATATLSLKGEVDTIAALTGGSGYISAPVVTFSGGGGFGAAATATISLGAVTGINITDGGQDYTSAPVITFSGGGGSGAGATAVLGFPVQSITRVAAGVGYTDVEISLDNGTDSIDYTDDCEVKYSKGVRAVTLTSGGDYFAAAPTITFTPIDGNGSGAAATAILTWGIKDIEIDNPGSGYLDDDANDVTVIIAPPSGPGTQATATPYLGNGVLSGVELDELGQGYTAAPHVYMVVDTVGLADGVPPTRQAEMTATVSGGQLTGITITDPGAGYDFDSYVSDYYFIDITTFNSEADAEAQANPKSGTIDYIQITNPGAGYVVAPKVEIVNSDSTIGNGFGTGAAATATIVDGRVTEITLTNAGSGYYVIPDVIITVPWSLMTAVGRCVVNIDGRITGVDFPASTYPYTRGFGYDTPPTVTFTPSIPGKGTGAAGVAVVNDGSVDNVVMTNQGSGYIGKNNPSTKVDYTVTPNNNMIIVRSGKAYIRDVYFGTGKRTIEQ